MEILKQLFQGPLENKTLKQLFQGPRRKKTLKIGDEDAEDEEEGVDMGDVDFRSVKNHLIENK